MFFKLKRIVRSGKVLKNESLKHHTSFKIGGRTKFFVEPSSFTELIDVVEFLELKKIKYYVLGNGTNVLACDETFNGVVVSMLGLKSIRLYEEYVQVFAGVTINEICLFYLKHNMSGFEDAFGLPGSVGGAVVMNASAYNFEMKNMVQGVFALVGGKVKYFTAEECGFGYRQSVFSNAIVLSVDLKLSSNKCDEKRMKFIMELRKSFQPLNKPSAGSVFKRINDQPVSKIIDDLGLKGTTIGGAKISEKHAGFIVNCDNATAQDVKLLIELIKKQVFSKHGITLQEEIKFIEN